MLMAAIKNNIVTNIMYVICHYEVCASNLSETAIIDTPLRAVISAWDPTATLVSACSG